MDEMAIQLTVTDTGEQYQLACAESRFADDDQVAYDALDLDALHASAVDAMEGYLTVSQAQQLGKDLYNFLIQDRPWKDRFSDALQGREHVHVRLDVHPPLLRLLPWEMVYDGQIFLALEPSLRLSRVGRADAVIRPLAHPIQVVFFSQAYQARGAEMLFNIVQSRRDGLVLARQVSYQSLASLEEIAPCDVLHVDGQIDLRGQEMFLALDRQTQLPFDMLIQVCRQAQPQIVYLNAIEAVARVESGVTAQALDRLQAAGIPVVLGLSGTTTALAASAMAIEFYRGLVTEMATAAAVARTRRQLAQSVLTKVQRRQTLDWVGLVLYQGPAEGVTLGKKMTTELQHVSQSVPSHHIEAEIPASLPEDARMMTGSTSPFVVTTPKSPLRSASSEEEAFVVEQTVSPFPVQSSLKQMPAALQGTEDVEPDLDLQAVFPTHVAEPETLEGLAAALRSEDVRRQAAAVEALGLLGRQQAAARDVLIEVVSRQAQMDDPAIRAMAAEQLGYVADPAALDALLLALTDPDPDVRQAARRALRSADQHRQEQESLLRLKLPLQSAEAAKRVAPLNRAISDLVDLMPRQRVEALKQVEMLRFELIRPQPYPERIAELLAALGALALAIKSAVAELRGQIEWPASEDENGQGGGQ